MHIGGRALAPAGRRPGDAPGRDPRRHRGAASGGGCRRDARTFVGMPAFPTRPARRSRTPSCGTTWRTPPRTIRAKRARGRRRGRRLGGAAAGRRRDQGRRAAPTSTATCSQLEAALQSPTAPSCTGRATPRRPARSSPTIATGHGADEVVKVKSMATQEIGLNEALAAEGIAAWETDLAELIVQLGDDLPSHILVPGDPPQPGRDPRDLPAPDGGGRPARARGPHRRARPSSPARPGCTCARSSCARRWRSPAPTSPSPRPARWSWSSPRATAGCA